MPTDDPHPQERIARELLGRTHFVGIDADGEAHYFDWLAQEIAVIDDDGETISLPVRAPDGTELHTLGDWVEYHDWADEPRVASSKADTFDRALEVAK